MGNIYSENILDHYENPRNFGKLSSPTSTASDSNPVCGDEIEMQLAVDKHGKITAINFSGTGCAVSMASASMLTEEVKGKHTEDVKKMKPEHLLKLLGIPLSPVRLKCALLPFYVLKICAGEKPEALRL